LDFIFKEIFSKTSIIREVMSELDVALRCLSFKYYLGFHSFFSISGLL
jgi:hypothetical protein